MAAISVLIADDHLLLRDTLVHMLAHDPGFRVTTAATLDQATDLIAAHGPFDILLLDVVMPGVQRLQGVEVAVAANRPGAVVLLSGNLPRDFVESAIASGARGYIPKSLPARALTQALRLIAEGRTWLPVDHYADLAPELPPVLASLSPQEVRVLRHLCRGLSNKEIAREMSIGEVTIKTHMRSICAKIGARNRTEAALIGNTYLGG